jgi:hypothetical protein
MPRHRIESEPRHRALGRERRARLRAVSSGPPGHAKQSSGPGRAGVTWTGIGARASGRLLAVGTRFRSHRRRLLTGAVRGLLVSPWFAAGAGFVVAAGAFIYAPHASLDFGTAIGVTQCKVAGCHRTTSPGAPGIPAGHGDGLVTAAPVTSPPSAAAGLTFSYAVNWHVHGTFQMVLTVTSKHAIGSWRLAFVIPGATKVAVVDAKWQSSGPDGGTASGAAGNGGDADAGTSADGWGSGSAGAATADDGAPAADSVSLVVDGHGTPAAPASCVYDGAACHFSLS